MQIPILFLVIVTSTILSLMPAVHGDSFTIIIPEGTSNQGCEAANECYIPYEITIDAGDELVWVNEDIAFHTVTSGNPTDGPDGIFDSGMFKLDEQFSHKFERSGNYDYYCTLHPWMEGNVIVREAMAQESEKGGGCLVATAAYGTELAPQVQMLRELRDNKLLNTETGSSFVSSFNQFYYSFSPALADYQRENPLFKEAVKLAITPMIYSLSVLNYADMDSDFEVLALGTFLILLNLGMYVGAPAVLVFGIKKRIKL